MAASDPELVRLLIQELERHVLTLEGWHSQAADAHRALHALRGSAGLAGERELASALERLHRRTREGDDRAWVDAIAVVRTAVQRLSAGQNAVSTTWPIPPDDMTARPLDPLVRAQYAAEVTDRLARIDDALATGENPVESARALYRHIHTMKGAASAAGDEPMTWFCHGLEERLRQADSADAAPAAMHEVARWRVVLGALLDEPDTALAMLGARPPRTPPPRTPPPRGGRTVSGARRAQSEPSIAVPGFDEATATIRVPAVDVDRLLERLDVIERARERIGARAERGRDAAASMREMRASLQDALLQIGPPRPWGAPAAALAGIERVARMLHALGEDVDAASSRLRATEQMLREGVVDAKRQLSGMRQTTVGRIFARLTTAIESEARRMGRVVIVRTRGADETIDRRVAERLLEPCLQLVRNAVAHGIEAPEVRAVNAKPVSGTVSLRARKIGNRLRITIADDGAGVDVDEVRARAVAGGIATAAVAGAMDDDALLSLLFLPGFSTRDSTDLLAGRGIGLDVVRSGIQRMGGVVRLSSRPGEGLTARLDVPLGSGFVRVLWVRAGAEEYAFPAAHAKRVRLVGPDEGQVHHLLSCLGAPHDAPRYAIDLELESDDLPGPTAIGIDGVGRTDELLIRPLGALVSSLGPFAGAVARGDGSVRLAIDAWAIAARVRAMMTAKGV
jgi:two-component system chemotaxis sensor kinase CheA